MAQVKQGKMKYTLKYVTACPFIVGSYVPSKTRDHQNMVLIHDGTACVVEIRKTVGPAAIVAFEVVVEVDSQCSQLNPVSYAWDRNADASAHDIGGSKQAPGYWDAQGNFTPGRMFSVQPHRGDLVIEAEDTDDGYDAAAWLSELEDDVHDAMEKYLNLSGRSAEYSLIWIDFLRSQCRCLELQIALDSAKFAERFPERGV